MSDSDPRVQAFADFYLSGDYDEAELYQQAGDERTFTIGHHEWLVLTDEEADDAARESIIQSLWAFNPDFLASWVGIPETAIRAIQGSMYEDASEVFESLIGDDMDDFVDEAIGSDGRGHFLASYDSNEEQEGDYYIYRVN